MNSKLEILKRIKSFDLKEHPLPSVPSFDFSGNRIDLFRTQLEKNGARLTDGFSQDFIVKNFGQDCKIISCYSGFEGNVDQSALINPRDLEGVEVGILKAEFGVAENGALWVEFAGLPFRVVPFIVDHLVVVLSATAILSNMHEAYKQIRLRESGFGCFISGPSKTADIEQSLVIGAHCPLSFHVLLVD